MQLFLVVTLYRRRQSTLQGPGLIEIAKTAAPRCICRFPGRGKMLHSQIRRGHFRQAHACWANGDCLYS
jgi:hypothetical protein